MTSQSNPEKKKPVGILMDLSDDERARMLEESRQEALWQQEARRRESWAEGFAEGFAESFAKTMAKGFAEIFADGKRKGMAAGVEKVAAAMRDLGLDIETITQATGLTADKIKRLQ
jgi:flagellar biosynthesis/type III secretory pathway protein FliH